MDETRLTTKCKPVLKTRSRIKLPKRIPNAEGHKMSIEDKQEIGKIVAKALGKKYTPKKAETTYKKGIEEPTNVRYDSSELLVITRTKRLTAYIMTVTAKSPQRFRFTFVNRMHNYCLDIVEDMLMANSLRATDIKNKLKRKEFQHNAYVKLKLLGYISFLAYENNCILKKQYEEISLQLSDCINLLIAWTKSESV